MSISPAEVKTIREGLGLTAGELAQSLGTTERTVFNWEAGVSTPRAKTMRRLEQLQAEAAAQVRLHLEAFSSEGRRASPVILIEGDRPGWQRAIAFRVLQSVPELRIFEHSHDG